MTPEALGAQPWYMLHHARLALGLLATVLVLALAVEPAAAVTCEFETDGDGVVDLVVPDVDGNGLCDFPSVKTHLPGTLRVRSGQPVEFQGKPVIEADTILIEPGAEIRTGSSGLRSLNLVALDGKLISEGTLDLTASDDITLSSRLGSIDLLGPTRVSAADRLLVDARDRWVTVAPEAGSGSAFTLLGRIVDIRAKMSEGSILIDGARIGGTKVTIDAAANLSIVGTRTVIVTGQSLVTTDPARTGFPLTGDLRIIGTGDVSVVDGSVLDSGRNLTVSTRRTEDDVCFATGAVLEARAPNGDLQRIDLRGIRGVQGTDGSQTFTGLLLPAARQGECTSPAGDCPEELLEESEEAGLSVEAALSVAALEANAREEPKDTFLDEHNRVRAAVGVPKLEGWNAGEEKTAKALATKLAKKCSCEKNDHTRGGENLAEVFSIKVDDLGNGSFRPVRPRTNLTDAEMAAQAVKDWEAEKANFDPKATGNGNKWCKKATDECRHYSQIVWKKTTEIGCAVVKCDPDVDKDKAIAVCHYKPAGNTKGQTAY